MCGFIGMIDAERNPERLKSGLPWLARRGPDSQKLWISQDRQVGLLHARLSIVDSDPRAHQPLTNARDQVTVAMVGEIYNYPELKKQYSNYPFLSSSDTEMILAVYAAHGVEGFRLLKGMFAFALVDETRKKMILVRDSIGKKPLFVAKKSGQIYFGSTIFALLGASQRAFELSGQGTEHYWQEAFVDPATSLFQNIQPVQPGQVLIFDWNGKLDNTASCHPAPQMLYAQESLEEVKDRVGLLLSQAIRRRLLDNPQPTFLLSGGIDSTVIGDLAKKEIANISGLSPAKFLTLGAVIPWTQDEFFARYAARKMGLPLQIIRPSLNVSTLGRSIIKSLTLQDEPLGMPSYFLLERLVHAAAQHGRILITGDGGDEIFLGYDKVQEWKSSSQISQNTEGLAPSWMSDWGRKAATTTLLGHMLPKADRASAEQGVEMRCPLLDWDVVSYARSLPFEMLTHGSRSKSLLKDQLIGWPQWFLERSKLGFAYNLRWLWALSNYEGLRESITKEDVQPYETRLPVSLRKSPTQWTRLDIFHSFDSAWKLLVWSQFLNRYRTVPRG